MLTGCSSDDDFVYALFGFGNNVITDFTPGAATDDIVTFRTALFADFAAVQAASADVGDDVVITNTTGDTVTIEGVTKAQLNADDFAFFF